MYPVLLEPARLKVQPDTIVLYMIVDKEVKTVNINRTAYEILMLCDGRHSIEDIIFTMQQRYQEEYQKVKEMVEEFIHNSILIKTISISNNMCNVSIHVSGSNEYWTPDFVDIEITHKCMLKCRHCYLSANMEEKPLMEWSRLKEILYEFKNLGVDIVQITGGEPLLHPQICSIINLLLQVDMQFIIVTSGFYYTPKILKCLEKISLKQGGRLQVSVDGLQNTHNYIRGNENAFKKTIEFIEYLTSKNVLVDTVTTINSNTYNEQEIFNLCGLMKKKGVRRFRISSTLEMGRAAESHLTVSKEFISIIEKLTISLRKKYEDDKFSIIYDEYSEKSNTKSCGMGYRFFRIDPEFNLYPCPLSQDILGNLKKTPLSFFTNKETKYHQIKPPQKEICGECEMFFLCSGCISQGLINRNKVEKCAWFDIMYNR